jgi:VanZ family protein
MRKFFACFPYWVPTVLWMGVIFFLSTLPESATPGRGIISDKICHGAEYFILAFLILFALQRTTRARFFTAFWITLVWAALYGLSDEIHQLYVPTRQFDVGDLLADVGGAVLLFLILWVLQRSGRRGAEIYRLLAGEQRK